MPTVCLLRFSQILHLAQMCFAMMDQTSRIMHLFHLPLHVAIGGSKASAMPFVHVHYMTIAMQQLGPKSR